MSGTPAKSKGRQQPRLRALPSIGVPDPAAVLPLLKGLLQKRQEREREQERRDLSQVIKG